MTERQRSKIGPGLVLAVALVPVGFVAGGVLAVLTTPPDAGLAGGAIALFKVMLGGAAALIAGVVLAIALPYDRLRRVQKVGLVVGLLATAFIAYRMFTVQSQHVPAAEREAAREAERRAADRSIEP